MYKSIISDLPTKRKTNNNKSVRLSFFVVVSGT